MYYNQVDVIRVEQHLLKTDKIIQSNSNFCIVYIFEGSCSVSINGRNHSANRDNIFILNPFDFVLVNAGSCTKIRLAQIVLSLSIPKIMSDITKCSVTKGMPGKMARPLVLKILSEAIMKPPLYRDSINLLTANLILEILKSRAYDDTHSNSHDYIRLISNSNPCLCKLIKFIDSNISKSITLQMLADNANASTATVNKLFKDELNTTPIQYINEIRISKAKELMMSTNLNITEIALMTGFKSVHYFSRYFKDKEGVTPLDYKDRFNKSISVELNRNTMHSA